MEDNLTSTFGWIDDTMIPILSDVEQKGVQVDRKKFFDRWPQITRNPYGSLVHLPNTIHTQ